ncbi:hypothetical protein B0T09DRAFT_347889 [Sordaria sp. MPI-SDFR-AT-0083]|nr:hypothetical protein B0T09DRAFT_347889 [Sordaria sp. MPI-SDFR-AT-0083]
MTSPASHHPDGHPDPDPDFHLHPPASHQPQPSYQPQKPPKAKSSSPRPQSDPHSPQQTSTPLHLPTSRQFLTSLITAISNIPLLDEPPTQVRKPPAAEPPTDENKEGTAAAATAATAETDTSNSRRKQLLQVLKEEGEGEDQKDVVTTKAKRSGGGGNGNGNVNPLKLVPPEYRHLLITLHVLFPGVVLPGLEVLERGLVERVILRCAATSGKAVALVKREEQKRHEQEEDDVTMQEDGTNELESRDENEKPKQNKPPGEGQLEERRRPAQCYLVRSSQFLNNTHPRRGGKRKKSNMGGLGDADTEKTDGSEADRHQIQMQRYLISLEAWNCTCAAFAFACCVSEPELQPEPKARGEPEEDTGKELPEEREEGKQEEGERQRVKDKLGTAGWTFGGMTLFDAGDHSSVPPVCKHLLACLLADKWRGALGRYVTERVASREEMAGVVAEV